MALLPMTHFWPFVLVVIVKVPFDVASDQILDEKAAVIVC